MLSQKDLEGVQLLGDTLDVVESVNTDDELDALEPLLELLDSLLDRILLERLVELSGLDSDRERADVGVPALDEDSVGHRRQAEDPRAGREEVASVVVGVETNEVAVEDTEKDLSSNRENSEGRQAGGRRHQY